MNAIALKLLGAPRIVRNDVAVPFARAKGIALLVYLAVAREAQPRERLVDLLWSESLPDAARKNMRNTLWALGEALGDNVLEQSGGSLRLAPGVLVDVHTLEDGLLLLESGSVEALERVAEAYRGPLADGLAVHEAPAFEIWLLTERERLAALYLRLLERAIALRRAAGDWPAVLAHARRALAVDPLHERLHLALIEAYLNTGQRASAMQQYGALSATLLRELDVAPLPETTARYEALLAGVAPAPSEPPQPAHALAPPTPFVGRRAELAALDEERARAARGEARVALLSGDLGMGKTQLWRAWADTRAARAVLLATHALETAEPVPFGPLLALFRQRGPAQALLEPPSPLAPIWLAELARVLPEVTARWPGLPAPLALAPAEERGRLLQALAEALRLLASPLLVLVVDDLHWADPSTLDWLVYLVDQLRDAPLLLIGAYRPQDATERLLTIVAHWQREGRLRQLPLGHLGPEEAADLLARLGPPDDAALAAEWVRQSGGNPYFLTELHRAQTSTAPCDLAALVRARVQATVPTYAMHVLQAAAVLGDLATVGTLQATSGRSEEETLDALDALGAAAVLVADGHGYRFVHPLVATVVRADLSPARRAFLHRRAGEALERAHAPHVERVAGALTEHFAAAGETGRATHYADLAAAQALAVGAFVEAQGYARRALEWSPAPQRRLALGEALMFAGSRGEAQAQLEEAFGGFERAADAAGATRACVRLALMAIGSSQPDLAREWLGRAPVADVEASEPELTARVYMLQASVERHSRSYAAAEGLLERAAQLVRAHRLAALESMVAFERGNLLANRGDLPGAVAAFEEALRLAQASASPVEEAMARNNLAYHTLLNDEAARAQAEVDAALELVERNALTFLWQYVLSTAGEIALARGALDGADSTLARAFEAAQVWGNRAHMANVRASQAHVAQARCDQAHARALASEALELLGAAGDPAVRDKVARVSAELGLG